MSRDVDRGAAGVHKEFAERRGCGVITMASEHPRIDRALVLNDELIGFAEVKVLNYPFVDPSFGAGCKVGQDKMTAAVELSFALALPTYLVIEFTDALVWLEMLSAKCEHNVIIRRHDRGTVQHGVNFFWREFKIDRAESAALTRLAGLSRSEPKRASAWARSAG